MSFDDGWMPCDAGLSPFHYCNADVVMSADAANESTEVLDCGWMAHYFAHFELVTAVDLSKWGAGSPYPLGDFGVLPVTASVGGGPLHAGLTYESSFYVSESSWYGHYGPVP